MTSIKHSIPLLLIPLLLLFSCKEPTEERPSSPNIIVIYADDLGYGDVQIYNPDHGKIPTPYIDQLAKEGMRFTDGHSSSAVCSPSRYTLLTGRYHWRTRLQRGIVGRFGEPLITPARLTVASLAKQKEYGTACIGKWHLGWDWPVAEEKRDLFFSSEKNVTATEEHIKAWQETFSQPIPGGPTAVGFDEYFGTDIPNWPPFVFIENEKTIGIPTEFGGPQLFGRNQASLQGPSLKDWRLEPILPTLGDKAVDFIDRMTGAEKPFLLYMPLTSPHTPLSVNEPWKGKSGLGLYADLVMETDAVIGRVLVAVKENGIEENTIIIFTSDNGCAPYVGSTTIEEASDTTYQNWPWAREEHEDMPITTLEAKGHLPSGLLKGYKSDAWEGGHRVPFIVKWPGVTEKGSVNSHLVHQADILATLADILELEIPADAGEDGFSMVPLLKGGDTPIRENAVSASIRGLPAVRSGSWKLIPGQGSGGWSPGGDTLSVQLYDLKNDLAEQKNLATEFPGKVAEMKALLEKLITDGRSNPGPPQPNDVEVVRY